MQLALRLALTAFRRAGASNDASTVLPVFRLADAVTDGTELLGIVAPSPSASGLTGIETQTGAGAAVAWSAPRGRYLPLSGLTAGAAVTMRARLLSGAGAGPWSADAVRTPSAESDVRWFSWNDEASPAVALSAGEAPIAVAGTVETLARPALAAPSTVQVVAPVGLAGWTLNLQSFVTDPIPAGGGTPSVTYTWTVVSDPNGVLAAAGIAMSSAGVIAPSPTVTALAPVAAPKDPWCNAEPEFEPLRGRPVTVRCTATPTVAIPGSLPRTVDIVLEVEARTIVRPEDQGTLAYSKTTWLYPAAGDDTSTIYTVGTFGASSTFVARFGSNVAAIRTAADIGVTVVDAAAGTIRLNTAPPANSLLRVQAFISRDFTAAAAANDVSSHLKAALLAARNEASAYATGPVLWLSAAVYKLRSSFDLNSDEGNQSITIVGNRNQILVDARDDWETTELPNTETSKEAITTSGTISHIRWVGVGECLMEKRRTTGGAISAVLKDSALSRINTTISGATDAARSDSVQSIVDEVETLFFAASRNPRNMFQWDCQWDVDFWTFKTILHEVGDPEEGPYTRHGTFAPEDAPQPLGNNRWSKASPTIRRLWPWVSGNRTRVVKFAQASARCVDESTNTFSVIDRVHVTAALPTSGTGSVTISLPNGVTWPVGGTTGTLTGGAAVSITALGVMTLNSGTWADVPAGALLTTTLFSSGVIEAKVQQDKPGGSPIAVGAATNLPNIGTSGYWRRVEVDLFRAAGNNSENNEGGFWLNGSGNCDDFFAEQILVDSDFKDEAVAVDDSRTTYGGSPITSANAGRFQRTRIRDMTIRCRDGSRGYALSIGIGKSNFGNPWMFDPDVANPAAAELAGTPVNYSSGIKNLTIEVGDTTTTPFLIRHGRAWIPVENLTLKIDGAMIASTSGTKATFRMVSNLIENGASRPRVKTLNIEARGTLAPPAPLTEFVAGVEMIDGPFHVTESLRIRNSMTRTADTAGSPAFESVADLISFAPGARKDVETKVRGTRWPGVIATPPALPVTVLPPGPDLAIDSVFPVPSLYPVAWGLNQWVECNSDGLVRYDENPPTRRFDPNGQFNGLAQLAQTGAEFWLAELGPGNLLPLATPGNETRFNWNAATGVLTVGPSSVQGQSQTFRFTFADDVRLIAGQSYAVSYTLNRSTGGGSKAITPRIAGGTGVFNAGLQSNGDVVGTPQPYTTTIIAPEGPAALGFTANGASPEPFGWAGTISNISITGPIARRGEVRVTGRAIPAS